MVHNTHLFLFVYEKYINIDKKLEVQIYINYILTSGFLLQNIIWLAKPTILFLTVLQYSQVKLTFRLRAALNGMHSFNLLITVS